MIDAVAISGVGACTPLGHTADATWGAVIEGRSLVHHGRVWDGSTHGHLSVNRLAERAGSEAAAEARWDRDVLASRRTALVLATSKGPVRHWLNGEAERRGSALTPVGVAETAVHTASALRLGGPVLTCSAACASGLAGLIRGAVMLAAGEADRVLVVAAEASVHELFIGSFRRLGVLAPTGYGCRPFDADRRGFVMSDAAAAVCLERPRAGDGRRVVMDRVAQGADPSHLTGMDRSGETLAHLLASCVDETPIDLVHAHGTGTPLNDETEWNAMRRVFAARDDRPAVYSHKGSLGHSLGTAGLLAVVINVIAHRQGVCPPNVNTTAGGLGGPLVASRDALRREIRCSIALAAGFGGACAAVRLRHVG